jgi:hypothetical protein
MPSKKPLPSAAPSDSAHEIYFHRKPTMEIEMNYDHPLI